MRKYCLTTSSRSFSSFFRKLDNSWRHSNVSLHSSAESPFPHLFAIPYHLRTSSSVSDRDIIEEEGPDEWSGFQIAAILVYQTEKDPGRSVSTLVLVSSCTSEDSTWRRSASNLCPRNFAMVSRWKNYVIPIFVTTFCTWSISKGNGEKIICEDLQLGQYPFMNILVTSFR